MLEFILLTEIQPIGEKYVIGENPNCDAWVYFTNRNSANRKKYVIGENPNCDAWVYFTNRNSANREKVRYRGKSKL